MDQIYQYIEKQEIITYGIYTLVGITINSYAVYNSVNTIVDNLLQLISISVIPIVILCAYYYHVQFDESIIDFDKDRVDNWYLAFVSYMSVIVYIPLYYFITISPLHVNNISIILFGYTYLSLIVIFLIVHKAVILRNQRTH